MDGCAAANQIEIHWSLEIVVVVNNIIMMMIK
jgi:hypothetical protein